MKTSLKWLQEFFPQPGPDVLAKAEWLRERLPFAGIEIGSWRRTGEGLGDVLVGQILSFEKHPSADRLNVCKVAYKDGAEPLQIVCGAPNVKVGVKVALAPVGATLPGNFQIKQAKIRGVDSSGMLCSEKELGLSEESNGIMHLQDALPVGSSFVKAMNMNDEIWDVELTPDRADALSHLGLAREVGRLLVAKPTPPESESLSTVDVPLMGCEVQAPKACPIYGLQLLEGATNRPSPEWLRRLLEALGTRSHGTLVDVTNFVLLELGHPLHAFDADKIVGSKVLVRFAKPGEKLVTLDEVERTLTSEDLVIADLQKPLALAGVMGGLESGVTEKTTRIALESAVFDPAVIRAMAARHKIHSEASHRFERGVDAQNVQRAAGRACMLFKQLAGARRRGAFVEIKSEKAEKLLAKHSLNFDVRSFKAITGIEAGAEEIQKHFAGVGIDAQVKSPNVLRIDVPTYRLDLAREIDLVEEAARLLGYDRIPARFPALKGPSVSSTGWLYHRLQRVRMSLVDAGLTEMMPYAFISDRQKAWVPGAALVELKNPLSQDWRYLRPNLTFGLFEVVARHAALGQLRGSFFDTGAVFTSAPDLKDSHGRSLGCRESWHAAWAVMGLRRDEHWGADKTSVDRKAQVDIFDAKGVFEHLSHDALSPLEGRWSGTQFRPLHEILASAEFKAEAQTQAPWIPWTLLHPGRSAILCWPGKGVGQIVGYVGELLPDLKGELLNLPTGFQLGVALAEIRFVNDLLSTMEGPAPEPVDLRGKIVRSRRLPVVERDLAIVFAPGTKMGEVDRSFRKAAGSELLDLRCIDVFRMPDGRDSVAFRVSLQGQEETLTDAQIQATVDALAKVATEKHGGQIR